jgi:hypothetical protein
MNNYEFCARWIFCKHTVAWDVILLQLRTCAGGIACNGLVFVKDR